MTVDLKSVERLCYGISRPFFVRDIRNFKRNKFIEYIHLGMYQESKGPYTG